MSIYVCEKCKSAYIFTNEFLMEYDKAYQMYRDGKVSCPPFGPRSECCEYYKLIKVS